MRYIEPTESQKRIWIIQKMYPNSAMFHIGGVFQTRGNVDMDRLYSAVLDALYKTQLPFIRLEEKEALFIQYCVEEQPLILKKDYRGLNVKSIIEAEFRRLIA